jgi:tRNA (cytidine32/guanosine34-2'-O)-methyltransferase
VSNMNIGPGNEEIGTNRIVVPFVACGDLSGFDSDQNYPLQVRIQDCTHSLTI